MLELSENPKKRFGYLAVLYLLVMILLEFLRIILGTLFRFNIENWAAEEGYNDLYKLLTPPEWLIMVWNFTTSDNLVYFALGAALVAFWDNIINTLKWIVDHTKLLKSMWSVSTSSQPSIPWDIKGGDALLYAIHRKWPLPSRTSEIDLKEVEAVFGVLDKFYDLAGNALLNVWGRPNGVSYTIKPIPHNHWDNFEIRYADVIGNDSGSLRTVLKRQSHATGPYFADLHLNWKEVLHFWPMEDEKS